MAAAIARRLAAAACLLLLAACAIAPIGQPVASAAIAGQARAAGLPPMSLGSFTLAEGRARSMDQKVSVRSNTLVSPYDSSFAAYLRETFATNLRIAGLFDERAPVRLSAELTDSQIDVPAGDATAALAARFTVTRGDKLVYSKELRTRSTWKAGFVGVEAVPMAVNRYEQLYRQLCADLLSDPDLLAALKR